MISHSMKVYQALIQSDLDLREEVLKSVPKTQTQLRPVIRRSSILSDF